MQAAQGIQEGAEDVTGHPVSMDLDSDPLSPGTQHDYRASEAGSTKHAVGLTSVNVMAHSSYAHSQVGESVSL